MKLVGFFRIKKLDQNNVRPNLWQHAFHNAFADEMQKQLMNAPYSGAEAALSSFNPSEFFIPGWKGEGLITASAIVVKNTLNNLSIDAQAFFKKSCATSKSMKQQTYSEFMLFADYAKVDKSSLTQPNDFWFHVQDDSSPLKKPIEDFFLIHCYRAVAIFLLRN